MSPGVFGRFAVSQSSIEKVPSGRSAMICKVGPLILTRTSLKPMSCNVGSTSAATLREGPVSRLSLSSVIVSFGQ